uniref:Phosphatidylinositol 3-kinase C2 domain-containing subunit gamma n=1 Tax=Nothoprocta perdicaria TaxID=30464 RepID=A0A8C7A140_NOTPE
MAYFGGMPLSQDEFHDGHVNDQASYSPFHSRSAGQIRLGFDQIADEVSNEIFFYGSSHLHHPEENFFVADIFGLDVTEQPPLHAGYPLSHWQQGTASPVIGFRSSFLPADRNCSMVDSYPYSEERETYGRSSIFPTANVFDSHVERGNKNLNFQIGFDNVDAQYPVFLDNYPFGQGMRDESGNSEACLTDTSRRLKIGPVCPSGSGQDREPASWSIQLVEANQGSNENMVAFCDAVGKIRSAYPAYDLKTNTGKIWSVATRFPDHILGKLKFRISVWTDSSPYPLLITQNAGCITHDLIVEILHCTNQYPVQEELCLCFLIISFFLSLHQQHGVSNVIEAAKTICSALCFVETRDITDAVKKLPNIRKFYKDSELFFTLFTGKERFSLIEDAVTDLSLAISHLIHVYSSSFDTGFQLANIPRSPSCADINLDSQLSFTVYAAHNIPEAWVSRINFPLRLKALPRETMLTIKLLGANSISKNTEVLAWTCCPLYPKQKFIHGTVLLSMTLYSTFPTTMIAPGICSSDIAAPVTLQIDFPETNLEFIKPEPEEKRDNLEEPTKECLKHIARLSQTHCLLLPEQKRRILWFYRYYCNHENCSLPLVLGSAPSWDRTTVSEMYAVLRRWRFSNPLEALGLLTFSFPDQDIRRTAVQQIDNLSNDELLEYLPQLVQVLKFEWSLESPLVKLLLNRSLQSIQVAHQLYWLLKNAQNEAHFKTWYRKLLAALQFCAGETLNNEFAKERKLIRVLEDIAEKVKAASDPKRKEVLKMELSKLQQFFQEVKVCRLPLNPALVVQGIEADSCSYFTSNALPLKISFINANVPSGNIDIIFKMGDDLRQDMLVLQIIRVMDSIWLQEGLDMQMIVYRCLSTGKGQGLVQMVPDATTLAKIHRKSGLIGPLKENTIKKWFCHHHPLESSYQEAIRNFFYSCAGWCVVTFILGVCDRHNDNIMLTSAGHMFHIDFGRFLGHAQTFGSIRRDRAPFIFTSEMEYFITEGGKNPQRFQEFVELCCRAYNIVRKHSQLLLNLLETMLHAGLPELNSIQDLKYVYDNLRPQDSDLQATSYFTRKIKESLECFPVKLNNLIHTLVQMSVTGSAKPAAPETVPQEWIMLDTEKAIARATILGFNKKPDSLYLVQVVQTCSVVTFVEKSFDQFAKLHSHLQKQFPSHTLPEFPPSWHLPFTDLEHKRVKDLNLYLKQLLSGPRKLNELVLSFFLNWSKNTLAEEPSSAILGLQSTDHTPGVQLVMSYEHTRLTIMLKHMRNLRLPDGSAPSAHAEFYLLPDPDEVTRRKTRAVSKSTDPTYNEIVVYDTVTELRGRVLKLVVKSKGAFVGAVNIQLSSVQLNEEKWYPLGNSII